MNPIPPIHRLACILAGLTAGLLALVTASPAAFARPGPPSVTPTALATPRPLPPGWNKHPPLPAHVHALATSGMPGWQIALIAARATALAAAVALPPPAPAAPAPRRRQSRLTVLGDITSAQPPLRPGATPMTPGARDHNGDIAALGPATSPPPERRPTAVNANDATLTELATAQSGSMVADNTPNAPAGGSFDLVVGAVAGRALGE